MRNDSYARETVFMYDHMHQQVSKTLPDGASTEHFMYDDYGRQIKHKDLKGQVTLFYYYDQTNCSSGADFYGLPRDEVVKVFDLKPNDVIKGTWLNKATQYLSLSSDDVEAISYRGTP